MKIKVRLSQYIDDASLAVMEQYFKGASRGGVFEIDLAHYKSGFTFENPEGFKWYLDGKTYEFITDETPHIKTVLTLSEAVAQLKGLIG